MEQREKGSENRLGTADLWAGYFVARRSQPHCGDAPSSRLVSDPNLWPRHPRLFMRWLLGNHMKRAIGILSVICTAALLLVASGRSAEDKSDMATLQGTWRGDEVGGNTKGTNYLIIRGKNFEFRGADTNEWYKGTFILMENTHPGQLLATVIKCSAPQYVGKISFAIYKLEDGKLTFTGNEPGNLNPPLSFNDPGARQFVLKKE
ncbi:MAG: hypothetical protein JWR26_2142 [Pedosphaera sp.]|nr:hypothetical protein [Pedosphaera sp.]